MGTQLDYGNWIRRKNLVLLSLLVAGVGALTFLPLGTAYQLVMAAIFVITGISLIFPLYAYFMFSQRGGKFQEKIYDLIVAHAKVKTQSHVLDIGSGNGVLAVMFAQQYRQAAVLGIDYWGPDWEYSQGVCEKNARLAGVEGRVHFQKGDAAALPFPAHMFDAAISNLTFHEVRAVADKKNVLGEALRVVKPGGMFAFVDYFYDEQYYGGTSALEEYLTSLKLASFTCQPITAMMEIPLLLRHPKALGRVGMIYGRK